LGFGFRQPEQANPILDRWGGYAYGNRPLQEGFHFTPEAVRAVLAGHGPVLVVLDDVWSLEAIKPFQDALPNEACLLITTRSEKLARDLRGKTYPLNVLSKGDALALLRERVKGATTADDDLLKGLVKALGYHAQALDIAGGSLDRRARSQWPGAVAALARQVQEGTGFGELNFPGEEVRVNEVEAALKTSYDDLTEAARVRFRLLGAFAPDASFNLAVAPMWNCESGEAEGQLTAFAEAGLLARIESDQGGVRWQQHSLLRAYALALLRRSDEEADARERHARTYLNFMHALDEAQQFYRLLPDYAQLKHAFEWAIGNSLSLALALASNTANLQAAFNLVRDNYDWASRIAERAKDSDSMEMKGAALGTLANALSRLATLPGENRITRLMESLAAYEAALEYRRPETAPL
ncbi:MAG: NB-ARC domain-containing protein, partial [Chloroflexota bacterium]